MPFPTYAKKDEIPNGSEDVYEEKDGKWVPIAPEDVTGLKRSLETIKQEKKDEEKARRKAEDERADLERKLAAAGGTGDEKDRVAKALAKFDADKLAYETKAATEKAAVAAELRTLKLDDKIKAAFLKAGGRPERADKALNDTKAHFDLADDGRIVVKDAKGEVTTGTVEDYFGKTYRAEMQEFYTGTKAAGGNAKGGASTSTTSAGGKWDGDAVLADPLGAVQAHYAAEAAATK